MKATCADAYRLFHQGTLAFAEMEANGIPVDLDYLTKAQREVKGKIKLLEEKLLDDDVWKEWTKLYGVKSSLTSHQQLGELLFKKMAYPVTMKTEHGLPSTDEKHLATVDLPFVRIYLERAKLDKVLNTYLVGIAREVDSDGLLHPVFSLAGGGGDDQEKGGAKSYRSCVAKGTKIEVVRDILKHPHICIEDVKVGDLVICYNNDLTLSVRKVLWAGKTGTRRVIRLHWMTGNKKGPDGKSVGGYLDVTPEHLIRVPGGAYVRADEMLKHKGHRTMAVSRRVYKMKKEGVKKYHTASKITRIPWNTLTRTGSDKAVVEAILVHKECIGPIPENHYVIHKDRNNLNNLPENLTTLHKAEAYILRAVLKPKLPTWEQRKELQDYKEDLDKNNHHITRIEELPDPVDVYDLEVEEFNNFIANEICVHNSSQMPNFQNMPIRNKIQGEYIRRCFIPGPGEVMGEFDYGGIEVKVAAMYTKDPNLIRYIEDPTTDMHRDQAADCYKLDFSSWKKGELKDVRYCAKNQFVFPEFYGSVAFQCAPALWRSIETMNLKLPDGTSLYKHLESKGITSLGHCQPDRIPVKGTFFHHILEVEKDFWGNRFPVYAQWKEDWWNDYRRNFYIDLLTGFRIEGKYKKNEIINLPIQGVAFHLLLWSVIELNKYLKANKCKTRIVAQIHDCVIIIGPRSEVEALLPIIKHIMTEKIRQHWKWIIVPLVVEADIVDEGSNWNAKHSIKI